MILSSREQKWSAELLIDLSEEAPVFLMEYRASILATQFQRGISLPAFERIIKDWEARGFAIRQEGHLSLTAKGEQAASAMFSALR